MSEGLDNATHQEFGGFRFDHVDKPQPIELDVTGQQRSFKISPDGTVELHGYSGEEVIKILTAYRKHMTELVKQAQAAQADNPLYHPGGYQ